MTFMDEHCFSLNQNIGNLFLCLDFLIEDKKRRHKRSGLAAGLFKKFLQEWTHVVSVFNDHSYH